MNIVFGVIIDSFAGLRDAESKLLYDKDNICFICSLSRSQFDHLNLFEHHIEFEHSPWNYLFFIYNIRFKQEEERRGLEVYVSELQKIGDTSWVPMGRAACFKQIETEDIEMKVRKIEDSIQMLIIHIEHAIKNRNLKELHFAEP